MPTCSVIICTRNRYQDLLRTLESLSIQSRLPDETIVVDASDEPYLEAIVPTLFGDRLAGLAVLRGTQGLTRQRNAGVRASCGEIVLFLDDDVVLEADYLERLLAVFARDAVGRYGGGMGQITGVRRVTGWRGMLGRLCYLGDVHGDGRFKPSGFPSLPHGREEFLDIECLSGANMAFRRAVATRVAFDEALSDYGYMEDDDYAWRVSRVAALFYEPAARLEHRQSSAARLDQRRLRRMLVRNHRYLFRKNLPPSARYRWAHGLSLCGLLLECVLEVNPKGLVGAVEGLFAPPPGE